MRGQVQAIVLSIECHVAPFQITHVIDGLEDEQLKESQQMRERDHLPVL